MWLVNKLRRRAFTPTPTNHCVLIWSHATCYITGKIIVLHTRYERWRRSVDFRVGKWYFSPYHWFSGIPTVTSRELYFRSWKQAECSLFVGVKVRLFSKEDLEGFVRVLPRALMSEVFQSVCNCFLSSKQSLKWILRNWDNFTTRSKVDLCSFLVSLGTLSFSFFQKGHKSCRGINKFSIGLSLLLHAFLVWI